MNEDGTMYNADLITSGGIVKSFSFPDGDIRGDTFYIKHLSGSFTVIDCYLKSGEGKSCRKREIINEIVSESKGRITRFISTHPDNDHILGLEDLDNEWDIVNFYSVANDVPKDDNDTSLERYCALKLKQDAPISKGLSRAWINKDYDEVGASGISFLWPNIENEAYKNALSQVANTPKGETPKPNNISCIILYSVHDGAKYMWMGDMETDMQEEFYKECKDELGAIDVLFHPHHGRKSSTPPAKLMELLDPGIIVIGNAPNEYLNRAHPDKTITQNTAGDIIFHNDQNHGLVHVYTSNDVDNMPECLTYDSNGAKLHKDMYYHGSFKPRILN